MRFDLIARSLAGLALVGATASCDDNQSAVRESPTLAPATVTASTTSVALSTSPTSVAPTTVVDVDPDSSYIDPASVTSAEDVGYASLAVLRVGDVRPINVWGWCDFAIEVGGESYQSDRQITMRGQNGYALSDLPPGWDVVVFNEAPSDGPSWVILNAVVERLDESTLEARNADDDTVIDRFELDTTPLEQRPSC